MAGDQCGEAIEQLERGEGEFSLTAGPGLGQAVAHLRRRRIPAEALTGEGGAAAVSQRAFETGAIVRRDKYSGVR